MTGERFEEWLASFFSARGYNVRLTPRTGDYGVDLFMTKDGRSTVVQAKRWKNKVGIKAIQEAYSGKALYKADAAIVVTSSHFTYEAQRLAKSTFVELWDRGELKKHILADRSRSVSKTALRTAGVPAKHH